MAPGPATRREKVDDPDPGDYNQLRYELVDVPDGINAELDGPNLTVSAPADTPPEARAALDTALRIFGTLRSLDPFEPLYLDTLAELRRRAGDLEGSARAFDSLLALLGGIEMPIPALYGVAIDTGTAVREDSGVHTGLEIWLD